MPDEMASCCCCKEAAFASSVFPMAIQTNRLNTMRLPSCPCSCSSALDTQLRTNSSLFPVPEDTHRFPSILASTPKALDAVLHTHTLCFWRDEAAAFVLDCLAWRPFPACRTSFRRAKRSNTRLLGPARTASFVCIVPNAPIVVFALRHDRIRSRSRASHVLVQRCVCRRSCCTSSWRLRSRFVLSSDPVYFSVERNSMPEYGPDTKGRERKETRTRHGSTQTVP